MLGVILVVALYVMVSNSIRLTIFARRDLITNMRYAGATTPIFSPVSAGGHAPGMYRRGAGQGAISLLRLLFAHLPFIWGPWFFCLVSFFPWESSSVESEAWARAQISALIIILATAGQPLMPVASLPRPGCFR